jgi:hypothetical protein
MADPAPNPDLLRSLGQMVRGLSALFWGLPAALIVGAGTASAGWFNAFRFYGFIPSLATTGLLLYGLWQLGSFQRQERPWRSALDRARIFALINFLLSPFLYWWNRVPEQAYFLGVVCVLMFSALLFLFDVNSVLQRLGEMLPDETLRLDTRQFTRFNRRLLVVLLALGAVYVVASRLLHTRVSGLPNLPDFTDLTSLHVVIPAIGVEISGLLVVWLVVCLLVLLPLAMTMALVWKMKEVILESVFGPRA